MSTFGELLSESLEPDYTYRTPEDGPPARRLFHLDPERLDAKNSDDAWMDEGRVEAPAEEANLVASWLEDDITVNGADAGALHSPVLDLDFPARLVPSSTPGHFHLYLDGIEMPWSTYAQLLVALGEAGILEPGYVLASLERGSTFVRREGVRKPGTTDPEPEVERKWQRDPACVERWPECHSFGYDPRCCRFPKSCSADELVES